MQSDLNKHLEAAVSEWNKPELIKKHISAFKASKQVNEADWRIKMTIWSRVIIEASKFLNKIIIDVPTVRKILAYPSFSTNTARGWATIIVRNN